MWKVFPQARWEGGRKSGGCKLNLLPPKTSGFSLFPAVFRLEKMKREFAIKRTAVFLDVGRKKNPNLDAVFPPTSMPLILLLILFFEIFSVRDWWVVRGEAAERIALIDILECALLNIYEFLMTIQYYRINRIMRFLICNIHVLLICFILFQVS